jgi:formylglycine-generating enzyme required for sulfatase activity
VQKSSLAEGTHNATYTRDTPVPRIQLTGEENKFGLGFERQEAMFVRRAFVFHRGSGDGTLEFWVKVPPQSHPTLFWSSPVEANINRFHIYVRAGSLGCEYIDPAGVLHTLLGAEGDFKGAKGDFKVPANAWTHVAITRSGNTYRFYRDGAPVYTIEDGLPILPTTTGWKIHGRPGFPCCIDEVRISNKALRPSEFLNASEVVRPKRDGGIGVRPKPLDCTGVGVFKDEVQRAQEDWARYLGRAVEETIEIADGVRMTFVLVPPGKFRMGSPQGEKDRVKDETLHTVTLTEPFDLAKTELTQAQYEVLTEENPSKFKGRDKPVEQVSWEEARRYAEKLTKKRGDGCLYRLPTEAEWEYSCRGGRSCSKPFGIGDGLSLSFGEANFNWRHPYGGAKAGVPSASTCDVSLYPANALGLHDMHGNVWEWCQDWYEPYPGSDVTNPVGCPPRGTAPVIRGGSWSHFGWESRAARRGTDQPGFRAFDVGFRLARCIVIPSK